MAVFLLVSCAAEPPFDDFAVDQTALALRVDGIDMNREQVIQVGEILCMGKEDTTLDNLMPGFWAKKDRIAVVEYTAEYMCDYDLADPAPHGDPNELFANRVWNAYERVKSPNASPRGRQHMEIYSEVICEALNEDIETHSRVSGIKRAQRDLATESNSNEWSYGEAVLVDRAIVEEVCIP